MVKVALFIGALLGLSNALRVEEHDIAVQTSHKAGPYFQCPGDTTLWWINNHRKVMACCPPNTQLSINGANDQAVCCPHGQPVSHWTKSCGDGSYITPQLMVQA